jgi:hypothetical protein
MTARTFKCPTCGKVWKHQKHCPACDRISKGYGDEADHSNQLREEQGRQCVSGNTIVPQVAAEFVKAFTEI